MGTVWEIDFYSRPLVDENQKKRWELLVCESPLSVRRSPDTLFRYAQYCPSDTVNSEWLAQALRDAIDRAPAPPSIIRFFRRQMNNTIVRASKELGIDARLGRRTFALHQWLAERLKTVYPLDPGYQASALSSPSVRYQPQAPQPLPDALEGQKWAFATLSAEDFADLPDWDIDFGESFPLELFSIESDTRIPGVIIFSPRAFPLAAWLSGLELDFLKFAATPSPQLLLETGADTRWILANVTGDRTLSEARGFESFKQAACGVHFLAIQTNPETESFAGFWLLSELDLADGNRSSG
ncbi:MAG: Tab2/Atab2 family RNA-binding protein [Cyanobacteria bacterium SID2]|nr:Tab2/Atab2 family RNA-binding protein [Cyanobacteria bacterium SID2]MBP0005831.1 Tab2/Atab2 family RNA-binding protein [Cyanobacteria bacterium SBC]